MATLTMLTGTPEELKELFPDLLANISAQPLNFTQTPPDTKTTESGDWTEKEFETYWGLIKPSAKEFLKLLSDQPVGCHADVFKEKLGWSFNEMAGKLTSLEFQWKKFPGKDRVYSRIGYTHGHTYTMKNYIAEFVKQLA